MKRTTILAGLSLPLVVVVASGQALPPGTPVQEGTRALQDRREAPSPGLPPGTLVQEAPRPAPKAQPRPFDRKIKVDPAAISMDDGDTVTIRWGEGDQEIVRILGIDTPETRHDEHNIPMDQPYGLEARAFAMGAFATAAEVELLRCGTLDPYGRTLGYVFLNGKNYSLLAIKARLAEESVTRYGDNGFPEIAAEVLAAAKLAGPPPFEPPGLYRNRMRTLSGWMKEKAASPPK